MKRTTFIIPKHDNDGRRFPTSVIAQIQQELLERFPGFTVKEVRGAWKGPDGKVYWDDSWEYTVVLETEEEVSWIERFLERKRDLLSQEAMWLEVSETVAKLI